CAHPGGRSHRTVRVHRRGKPLTNGRRRTRNRPSAADAPASGAQPRRRRQHERCAYPALGVPLFGAAGTVKRKTVPPPVLVSQCSLPPCASTIERQIERPRPMPLGLVETKGSNSLPAMPSG